MPALSRYDRHVVNGRLTVGSGAPIHTLVFNVEEALRLCTLSGETEGRTYYFRRLQVRVPQNAGRQAWLDAFQRNLQELASQAVYAGDAPARDAEAVYFLSEQEACESLLALVFQARPLDAWFWPAVSGSPAGSSAATHVRGVIEKLSRSEASWVAVASAVFATGDPIAALHLLPQTTVREWLPELGGTVIAAPRSGSAPLPLPQSVLRSIKAAAAMFGFEDERVLWLAALAVVLVRPSEMESGQALSHAWRILQTLAQAEARERQPEVPPAGHLLPKPPAKGPNAGTRAAADHHVDEGTAAAAADAVANRPSDSPATRKPESIASAPDNYVCLGQPTAAAGLFFLLNALKHLKFHERQLEPQFAACFFQRVARHAGIAPDDPILVWTLATLEANDPYQPDERLLRRWLRNVRRWCWRNGKIGLREIVRRPGFVTLTRTDLDVSLALDTADIRIRRIGLDLDPGWLPWFGRVVRFHYLYRSELYG